MARIFSADLRLVDQDLSTPASMSAVLPVVGKWTGVTDITTPGHHPGRRGAEVDVDVVIDDDSGQLWRLVYSHQDSSSPEAIWRTEVTVSCEQLQTVVLVRLDLLNVGTLVVPTVRRLKPPGIMRGLVDASSFKAIDAGRELTTEPQVVRRTDVLDYADLVRHPERRLPIVAYTPRDDDVIDGQPLAESLAGLAHVVLVLPETSWALNGLIPRNTMVYGGAARIIWPGASDSDRPNWHYLYFPDRRANDVVIDATRRICDAANSVSGFEHQVRDRERSARLASEGVRFRELQASILTLRDGDDAARSALSKANETITELIQEREVALDMAGNQELLTEELRQANRRLVAERDTWKDKFERLSNTRDIAIQDDLDEAKILERDILTFVNANGSVVGARLRPFKIGGSFIQRVELLGPSYREKVIKTAGYLVINAPQLLSGRDDHPLRNGLGANSGTVKRKVDGATARRCAIEQGTPGARRLHYWVSTDGEIELASVNTHDDMEIPE